TPTAKARGILGSTGLAPGRESDKPSPSVLTVRVPPGQHLEPFVPDVDCRVEVAIKMGTANAVPLPIRERQPGVDRPTHVAHLGRRKEAVDDRKMFSVPEAFVFDLSAELAHRGIREALGQLGSRKALHGQVLDAKTVVVVHQAGTQL